MSVRERKEREKQELREKILAAAMEIYVAEGYEKTVIRAIAEKIEYSPATVYLYFKDKAELFFALQEQSFLKFLRYMEAAVGNEADPITRLHKISMAYMAFAEKFPQHYDLMFIMIEPMQCVNHSEFDWKYARMSLDFLRQTLAACIESKQLPVNDLEAMTLMYWSIVHGVASLKIRCRLDIFPKEDLQLLIQTALDILSDWGRTAARMRTIYQLLGKEK
jgi:AcrR family transcriptional regulator